jgi:hypothetical protein
MALEPINPEALLTRQRTAEALTDAGYQTAPNTLAKAAWSGKGPLFRKYGRITLYKWGDALSWAQERAGPPRRSASEAVSQAARALAPDPREPFASPSGTTRNLASVRAEEESDREKLRLMAEPTGGRP